MNVTTSERQDTPRGSGPGAVQQPWLVVTVREIMVKLRDRNFLISTAVTLAMMVGAVAVSTWFSSRTTDYTVAVTDADAAEIVRAADELAGGDSVTALERPDPGAARAAVEAEDADAALLAAESGWTLVGLSEVSNTLDGLLRDAVTEHVMARNAEAAGTTMAELRAGSEVTVEVLDGDADSALLHRIVGIAFAFLFYMAAIIFGMTIATSVLEEKQNRVVEILATAIPIRQILYGKVVGNSALALAQIALYVVVGLVALNFTDLVADIGFLLGAAGWFIVFFVVGFFALAAVWAVLGSLASRTEDLNSNTGPVMMLIMVATFGGIFATGTWLTVASFIPIVSTVGMPIRMLDGGVPLWQTLVSLAGNLLAAYVLVRIGERIYQRAVLQGGTALSWRQAFRLEA
ncbi:ABC transporter permease [Georgenia deserti]|uniref:ABC transporter permease n=1 Tax=Georgenia deserti TaxID=2093781 RepID=A0ABW4L4K1_9MICO